ncbi:Hypothetical protein ORPV_843 [Orpheovirus IHUMI-LCC2]|uniref:Uncharacterized protein n=1 Tax=Orpheovirus IHUMI-LCC2 TaxID=2023057 RepID=A0A2I2L5E7_9VIRU|nr:Hypothetical protein ORPV_843 [Orpheovirus IHUMI-LCC2]SNW62747.1 Hypothetical protein ORPV_843 [Orpheovirus IHUMI-LCC2]
MSEDTLLSDIQNLPNEVKCNILSNFTTEEELWNIIEENDAKILNLLSYCIRKIVANPNSMDTCRLLSMLPNVTEVEGIINIQTIEEIYMVLKHPSLIRAIFNFKFEDDNINMIYQFINKYSKDDLLDISFMFYLPSSKGNEEYSYLYISGDTLFLQYYGNNIYDVYIRNILDHLLSMDIYNDVYLWINWEVLSNTTSIYYLNKIPNPINVIMNIDVLTPVDLYEAYNGTRVLPYLDRINVITNIYEHIDDTIFLTSDIKFNAKEFIAPFYPSIIPNVNLYFNNLEVMGIGLNVQERYKNMEIEEPQIQYINEIIDKIPNNIKITYIFTSSDRLLLNNIPFAKNVIFKRPNVISLSLNDVYNQF